MLAYFADFLCLCNVIKEFITSGKKGIPMQIVLNNLIPFKNFYKDD